MRIILTTTPPEVAPQLVRTLLEERLIACCNILPSATSMYWWNGEITTDTESLLVIKTTAERITPVMERIRALHPYEVPEIVVLPVETAFEGYATWVRESCRATLED
ncbi:Divalent-cation tolerance protein CutA [compost metagenome]